MDVGKLIGLTEDKLGRVRQELDKQPENFMMKMYESPGRPVKRKILETIYERLTEIHHELELHRGAATSPPDAALFGVQAALDLIDGELTMEKAWHVADSLKAVTPSVAQAAYLQSQLSLECMRPRESGLLWSQYFSAKELETIMKNHDQRSGKFRTPALEQLGAQRLERLYKERNDSGRHGRARAATRGRYLRYLSLVLIVLALLLAFADDMVPEAGLLSSQEMLLILCGGALGAALSRAIQIRSLERITELQVAWAGAFAQLTVGASLAAIVVILLQTGLVNFGGESPAVATWITAAFLSGFSEPFALGILERVSGPPSAQGGAG